MALADNRLQRTLTLCALYLAQGIPWGFMSITLVSFLNDKGLDEAGGGKLKAIILLPWAFKLIWAPLLDSVTIRSMGRRRFWILLGQLGMAATLLVMLSQGADVLRGEMDVGQVAGFLAIAFFIHNCFASLQDVATDALAVDILPPEEQGLTNGLMWGAKLFGQRGGAWLLGAVLAGSQNGLFNAVLIQLLALAFIMVAPILFLERKGEKRFPWSSVDIPKEKTSVSSAQNPYHIIRNLFGGFSLISTLAFAGVPLVAMLGFGSIEVINSAMYTSKLGWTSAEFSEVAGGYTIPLTLVGTILGGILGDRFGRRLLICFAVLGFSITVVCFSLVPEKWGYMSIATVESQEATETQTLDLSELAVDSIGDLYSFRITVREMGAEVAKPKIYKTGRIVRDQAQTLAQQVNESSLINGESSETVFLAKDLGDEKISLTYRKSANYLPAIITGPRSTLSKIFLVVYPLFFACYVVNFLAGAMNLSWTQSAASMFTVYMTLSNVGDVVGKNAAGAIAQTFTTMGVYGERIVDYPMVFRVIAGLALMSLILLPVINFNYLKELKASNTNPKMTPVPDGFTKNDLQFIGRVRTGLLLLIPTLVWFLLVFIDSLMQRTLLAEHLVYWINIAAIICSLVGLGFLVQAPVWHHVRSMLRMGCIFIGAGAAILVIDRFSLLPLGEFQEYLPAVGGTCFVLAFLLSLTSLHELGTAISDKTTVVLSWPPLAILMLIFLISCLVYLPMSAVEALNQSAVGPEFPTTSIGGLITIIQWLAVIMLVAFCLFLIKACSACKSFSASET